MIMIEIIPAINADSFEEVEKRIKLVESHTDWVHIDVADGTFTKNTLWHNAADLNLLNTKLNIEIHLMINDVERRIDDWLISGAGVRRIIFHIGGCKDSDFVIKRCEKAGIDAAISIALEESVVKAMKYKDNVNLFQILGVRPGLPGQKIIAGAYERIKEVRNFCGSCIIEIDGGMNKETIPLAIKAGANRIVAASAIFNDKDTGENIKELKSLCRI